MEDLQRFASLICWLDEARWQSDEWGLGWDNDACRALNSQQKVLAHWITYITDMRMPVEVVWERGLPVFAELVYEYTETGQDVVRLLARYTKSLDPSGKKVPILSNKRGTVQFTPRYSWHYDQIIQCLHILETYGRSLVQYMKHWKEQYESKDDGLRRIAHVLDLLAYCQPEEQARLIIGSRSRLEEDYPRWEKKMQSPQGHGRKRLWAALRDYFKSRPLKECIAESFSWPETFDLRQLELPGDIWNDRFASTFLHPLAERNGLSSKMANGKYLSAPVLAKQIDSAVRKLDPLTAFYPERLDVSFDFASRMCDNQLCDICVFGGNEAQRFCTPTSPPGLCPVLFVVAGYKRVCKPQWCPVAANLGIGLCKRKSQ